MILRTDFSTWICMGSDTVLHYSTLHYRDKCFQGKNFFFFFFQQGANSEIE